MVGLKPPPHDWVGNDGKGIYFDSIDNSAYILGKAPHSARNSWVYIDGENFNGARFFLCPLARATRTAGGAVRIPAGSFATGRACIGSIHEKRAAGANQLGSWVLNIPAAKLCSA